MKRWTRWAIFAAAMILLWPIPSALAEYRAYELEVVDVYDCRINKRERCRRSIVRGSLPPDMYARLHGGRSRIAVIMLATWMCWGDTSGFRVTCPRPAPRDAKFGLGDQVRIDLGKHITDGWEGKVEIAYFQRSVNSNVYGVRFPDRQEVFARYFEKDLVPAGATPPRREPPQ